MTSGTRTALEPWWALKVLAGVALVLYSLRAVGDDASLVRNLSLLLTAQAIAVIGGLIHLIHYVALKRRTANLSVPDQLVTDTLLFRWIRHPMYLGDAILALGFLLLVRDAAALLLTLFILIAVVLQARVEDRRMEAAFGLAFQQWKRRTGLLVPFL